MAKVVHITSSHPLADTRIFHKMCRTLKSAGHDVVLIAPHDSDTTVSGIRVRAIPKARNRLERVTRTMARIYRLALEERGDVYHIHDPELLLVGRLLASKGRVLVYDMHENLPKQILNKGWIHPRLRRTLAGLVRVSEKVLLRNVPLIFAEDSYGKDYTWAMPTVTVRNMPRIEQFEALGGEDRKDPLPSVAYVGAVTPERGSIVTIEALKILQDRRLPVRFHCIGALDHRHRAMLTDLARKYALEGITLHGYLPPERAWSIMARCHIGIAVLQPIPNYIESYPTKMFEYMALGLPVIASNFPLYEEVVVRHRCGICVDPKNPDELADALQWCVEHPNEAAEMGQRARAAVLATYNWNAEASSLLAFYSQILERMERA